jgi:probable F420-dependent oxidoreductase
MKFCLVSANTAANGEPDIAIGLAQLCEELGFESIWAVERPVIPSRYTSKYPYSSTGLLPGGSDSPIADPLLWLAFVGAATTHLRLGTGVLVLPLHSPLLLAKQVATLDRLTQGRVEVGIGVGWLREEFESIGVPFASRGPRTDEYVDVLRRLWREPLSEYDGQFTQFALLSSFPKPASRTGPSIHIGGHTIAAANRAGRIGDGFFVGHGTTDLAILIETMRCAAADAGRDPSAIEISAGVGLRLSDVRRAEELGVARMMVPPLHADPTILRTRLKRFADRVIART